MPSARSTGRVRCPTLLSATPRSSTSPLASRASTDPRRRAARTIRRGNTARRRTQQSRAAVGRTGLRRRARLDERAATHPANSATNYCSGSHTCRPRTARPRRLIGSSTCAFVYELFAEAGSAHQKRRTLGYWPPSCCSGWCQEHSTWTPTQFSSDLPNCTPPSCMPMSGYLAQLDHLRAGEEHRPVAVRGQHVHRTIHVEHRIPAHARADAGAFHLPLLIHLRRHGIPAQRHRGPEGQRIQPAAIDAARDTRTRTSRWRRFPHTTRAGRAADATVPRVPGRR